jgi:xylulokinase
MVLILVRWLVFFCPFFCVDGLGTDTVVAPFTADFLSTYLSLCPSPNDAVLSFGPMDILMTPAHHYIPTRLFNLFPHPVQESSEKRRYISVISSR